MRNHVDELADLERSAGHGNVLLNVDGSTVDPSGRDVVHLGRVTYQRRAKNGLKRLGRLGEGGWEEREEKEE